jgi:hypothetical protein
MKFGEVNISEIEFDLRCRDEIPKLLMGLQKIYCTPKIREEVFKILESVIPEETDTTNGRPGMELWKILVLGTLRLNCNWDYDKLQDIANNHRNLRQMLGHGLFDEDYTYPRQTLIDNVSLLSPEVLDRINQVVVKWGHKLLYKKKDQDIDLKGKCDSFVVETDVHYPTDINLLFDAIGKVITLLAVLCSELGIAEWRQSKHLLQKIKNLFRCTQKLKHSTSKNEQKQIQKTEEIKKAHKEYVDETQMLIDRAQKTIQVLRDLNLGKEKNIIAIEKYIAHAQRQINQIRRRVIYGETIPHHEKVFSIFEEHTQWISQGKAGVPQELGVGVCIVRDQFGFILHHSVMEDSTDDSVAVLITQETKQRFANLKSGSFDRGFYSPENKIQLNNILDFVILPKKGRLSISDMVVQQSDEFRSERRRHSCVESSINALENHGLDRCLDHGLAGFKRYVALAVVARNIQILGHILQQQELNCQKRSEKLRLTKERKIFSCQRC